VTVGQRTAVVMPRGVRIFSRFVDGSACACRATTQTSQPILEIRHIRVSGGNHEQAKNGGGEQAADHGNTHGRPKIAAATDVERQQLQDTQSASKAARRQVVQVHYREDEANHSGPESCGVHREVCAEALTGDTGRLAIEPRNHHSKTPTPSWRRALLRRSQKHRLNWLRFNRLTRRYVPTCQLVHPLPPCGITPSKH